MRKEPHEGEYMNYIEIVVNKEAFVWRLSGLCNAQGLQPTDHFIRLRHFERLPQHPT